MWRVTWEPKDPALFSEPRRKSGFSKKEPECPSLPHIAPPSARTRRHSLEPKISIVTTSWKIHKTRNTGAESRGQQLAISVMWNRLQLLCFTSSGDLRWRLHCRANWSALLCAAASVFLGHWANDWDVFDLRAKQRGRGREEKESMVVSRHQLSWRFFICFFITSYRNLIQFMY